MRLLIFPPAAYGGFLVVVPHVAVEASRVAVPPVAGGLHLVVVPPDVGEASPIVLLVVGGGPQVVVPHGEFPHLVVPPADPSVPCLPRN